LQELKLNSTLLKVRFVFRDSDFENIQIIIKKRITVLGKKKGSTEHSKGNKTVPEKVATTRTEDGHE
jgi:hypothetical protein